MLPQETHHLSTRTHTLWNKDAQKATTLTHGSMAHASALGLVDLVYYCSMLQMGLEAKARATEEDRVNTTTCMPGIYDWKIFIDDKKAMLIPTQGSRDVRGGEQQIKRLYAWNFMMFLASKGQPVSESACENITSSVIFLFIEKASLSKWSEIRVLRIEKMSIVSLKDVVVLTQFSRDVNRG